MSSAPLSGSGRSASPGTGGGPRALGPRVLVHSAGSLQGPLPLWLHGFQLQAPPQPPP